MTSTNMGRRYIEEALGRTDLVRLAHERGRWSTVVREAQEAVELLLKGALRLVAVESARTHDVAELLRREAAMTDPLLTDADATVRSVSAGSLSRSIVGPRRRAPRTPKTGSRTKAGRGAD